MVGRTLELVDDGHGQIGHADARRSLAVHRQPVASLAITATAAAVLQHGRRRHEDPVQVLDAARETLAPARGTLDGELRISAPVGFARHPGPALAPLLAANPLLRLTLRVDDAMIDLVTHRIDLALRAGQLADSTWVARPIGRFEWLIVAAPAYLARAGVTATPADLSGHTWLSAHGGPSSLQLRPDVDDDLRSGRLVPVLPGWGPPPLPLWAVTSDRGAAQPAKVEHVLAALRETLRPLPGVLA